MGLELEVIEPGCTQFVLVLHKRP